MDLQQSVTTTDCLIHNQNNRARSTTTTNTRDIAGHKGGRRSRGEDNVCDSNVIAAARPQTPAALAASTTEVNVDGALLSEGGSLMVGEDGQRYITVQVQDGQTYAIPESDFHAMQQPGDGELTFQTISESSQQTPKPNVQQQQHIFMVPVSQPAAGTVTLQPVSGPPPTMKQKNLTAAALSPGQLLNKTFKPIRVDNWGIFLLNRLQAFFQRKEHCDLTLRFPSQNAQIKVHRLVVDACTDYFLQQEKEGKLVDGAIDMSSHFTPETVVPIVKFMYTGRLDLRTGMFSKLHDAATKLQMSVLAKLMDAQLNSPTPEDPRKKKMRRKNTKADDDDPVRQIRKIKRIERKVMHEEKKARMQAKLEAAHFRRGEQEEQDYGENTLPGKKLPIWKKRSNQMEEEKSPAIKLLPQTVNFLPQQQQLLQLRKVQGPPPLSGAKLVPAGAPAGAPPGGAAEKSLVTPSPKSYKRNSPCGEKRPKIPRQIREIQENLTFEKIRRTGAKNISAGPTVGGRDEGKTPERDMSVEEIREYMEEQRKRLQQIGEEEEDVYDNDVGLDYGGSDLEEEEEGENISSSNRTSLSATQSTRMTPAKAILKPEKADVIPDDSPTRKSVRFSLRPSNPPMQKEIRTAVTQVQPDVKRSPTSTGRTRGRPPRSKAPDSIIDDFNKAVEEEEALAEEELIARSRSGRPIIRKRPADDDITDQSSPRESPKTCPPTKRRRLNLSGDDQDKRSRHISIDLPVSAESAFDDQTHQAIVMNYETTIGTNDAAAGAGDALAKLHRGTRKLTRVDKPRMKKSRGLSKLVMDWDDDE